jgi:hypothetical protein
MIRYRQKLLISLAVFMGLTTVGLADAQRQEIPTRSEGEGRTGEDATPVAGQGDGDKPATDLPKKDPKNQPPKKPNKPSKQEPVEHPPLPEPRPIDVSLLRPDSLAGWDHSKATPSGWRVDEGRLIAEKGATPLLSGYSLDDFSLTIVWQVADDGAISINLPTIPGGPGFQIALDGGDRCGAIHHGDRAFGGAKAAAKEGGVYTTVIKRGRNELSVSIEGRQVAQVAVDEEARFGLGIAVPRGAAAIESMRLSEPLGAPIFNGENLDGWWTPGNQKSWQAIGGQLVLAGRGGNYLRTEKEYGNYTLSMEFRLKPGGNSGLGIRTSRNGWPSGDGMELQLLNRPDFSKSGMMAIYRNVPAIACNHETDEYNHLVVKAEGRMISAWMNGELVQQCNTAFEPELRHRNLAGWIGFQDHGAKIEIRHLNLRTAPDGLGLDEWYAPRATTGICYVLDRLMNPQRLAEGDGSSGSQVALEVCEEAKPVEHIINGPGAIVMIDASKKARLSLQFDAEETPCLCGSASEIASKIPKPPGSGTPLFTYVPFEKQLRVVLTGQPKDQCRLDVVALPQDVSVSRYQPGQTTVPANFAAALDYRLHHHRKATIRQHDPYLRIDTKRKTIAPGQSIELARAGGAGRAQWLQLKGDKRHLKTDDLWLEVVVDGQKEPSLAAPVRYYFAPVAAEGGYNNFLFTERDGPINRLAIPFADGIRFSLSNRGEQPIVGAGLAISIEQLEALAEGEMRLCGVFSPAPAESDSALPLFDRSGKGRLVGLIAESNNEVQVGVVPILIDGAETTTAMPPAEAGEFRGVFSGRKAGLAWRYFQLAPLDFEKRMKAKPAGAGGRLALFYMATP